VLHHEKVQMPVHEVFVHPFRLPAGARKWHISHFAVLLHSKYSEFPAGRGIASPGIFAFRQFVKNVTLKIKQLC